MKTFRAYLLDPAGKIVWGDWLEAASLEEAEARARELCRTGTPAVELWQGPRPISEVPCDPDEPIRRTSFAEEV